MLYIGLMSGTSMDAVDAVLVSIDENGVAVLAHHSLPLGDHLRHRVHQLSHPGGDVVALLGETDQMIGDLFAETTLELIALAGCEPGEIAAIGSHGQTIRHHPPAVSTPWPYSLQIGDPNRIAAKTGITTVADFRRKDIALGGQGAPLVPAFHQAVFGDQNRHRVIVNIGGIANITWLPPLSSSQPVIGFDTGPGNALMDAWTHRHHCQLFDESGRWAETGVVLPNLLEDLLSEPYLALPPPKSTGKELFNLPWLDGHLARHPNLPPQDVQATLCHYTAETIAGGLAHSGSAEVTEIYVCGGGAFNDHLMHQLAGRLPGTTLHSTAACGIHPMQVEAAAFAWLAHQTLNRLPGNLPDVTGARRPAILGGIYLP